MSAPAAARAAKPTDDELRDRATRAYFRRFGAVAQQPSSASDVVGDGADRVVVLRNCRGELARYRLVGLRLRYEEAQS